MHVVSRNSTITYRKAQKQDQDLLTMTSNNKRFGAYYVQKARGWE